MSKQRTRRKWRGILSQDLTAYGDRLAGNVPTFKKGQEVIVRKKRVYDGKNTWTGKYEYHYSDENDRNLVRHSRLLLDLPKVKK